MKVKLKQILNFWLMPLNIFSKCISNSVNDFLFPVPFEKQISGRELIKLLSTFISILFFSP
jgi:hypothetical protein